MGSLCLRKSLIHAESGRICQEKYCSLLALGFFGWFVGVFLSLLLTTTGHGTAGYVDVSLSPVQTC